MSDIFMLFLLLGTAGFQITFCTAARFGIAANRIDPENKNSISPDSGSTETEPEREANQVEEREREREWVRVTRISPPLQTFLHGDRIELECEAEGKPPPAIQWMRGRELVVQDEANAINNLMTTETGTGMAKIKSRLVLDCARPIHQGTYTCVGQAGQQTGMAAPANVIIAGGSNSNSCRRSGPGSNNRPPRITSYAAVMMELIGSDVILPCSAEGTTRMGLYWLDAENQVLTSRRPRFKVLASGALYIHKLRWEDMGGYTCVAQNDAGRDTANTFLYPLAASPV